MLAQRSLFGHILLVCNPALLAVFTRYEEIHPVVHFSLASFDGVAAHGCGDGYFCPLAATKAPSVRSVAAAL